MKILFTADWQASLHNLDRCERIVGQICDLAAKANREKQEFYVAHLGDAKDAFNPVDVRVANFLIGAVQEIQSVAAGFFFVAGNHDRIATQDGTPSLIPWIEAAGANAVADDCWRSVARPRFQMWMVPYAREEKKKRELFHRAYLDSRESKSPFKILAFHDEVEGCERSAYAKGKGLSISDLGADAYNFVVSGHIHRPHQFGPVHYVGSPFAQDWGEVCEEKRMLLLEI